MMEQANPGQIYRAIPLVMTAVGAIEKGRKNQQQNYAFRGIDDVFAAFQKPLAENGVFYVPEVLDKAITERPTKSGGVMIYTVLTVAYTFFAADGSHVRAVVQGEAMDSGDKSSNKAMSAALKYALLQIFCVPCEQDDADQETHELASKRPTAAPGQPRPSVARNGAPQVEPSAAALSTGNAAEGGAGNEDPLPEFAERQTGQTPEQIEAERATLSAGIKAVFLTHTTEAEFADWWLKQDGDNWTTGKLRTTLEKLQTKAKSASSAPSAQEIFNGAKPVTTPAVSEKLTHAAQGEDGARKVLRKDAAGNLVPQWEPPNTSPAADPVAALNAARGRLTESVNHWLSQGQTQESINAKIVAVCGGAYAVAELDAADVAKATHALNNWEPAADARVGRKETKKK